MKRTLEFIMNGAAVNRYHTCDLIKSETVGHHSHGVAMLCLVIDPVASRQLLAAALMHDLAEQVAGDIPSPTKRSLEIGDAVDRLEKTILASVNLQMPVLNVHEKTVLKLADNAHGALKCAREINMGNSSMRVVFDNYIAYSSGLLINERAEELVEAIKEMVK